MRDIKFRAWDSRNNEMVYSSETDCFYINTKGVLFMYAIPKSESGLEVAYHKSYEVDQYTGFQDSSGVEIYEGDIVDYNGASEVVFIDGCFNVKGFYETSQDYPTMAFSESYSFKVIGNIHESPELLK